MMKYIALFALIFTFPVSSNIKIPFLWESYKSNGVVYDKAAMIIPVIGEDNKFLQLDTGSVDSYIYGKKEDVYLSVKGNHKVSHKFKALPDMQSAKIIGTLGNDYFLNKCVAIDFPNQSIEISNCSLLKQNKQVSWLESYRHNTGHLMVGVDIGSNHFNNVMLDTGSSIFSLTLTKNNWLNTIPEGAENNPLYQIKSSSWGKDVVIKGTFPDDDLCIGTYCSKQPVYLEPNKEMVKVGIDGVIGNIVFLNSTLILNFQNDTVGVLNINLSDT